MQKRHAKRKDDAKREALERAVALLGEAASVARGDAARAKRLVHKARLAAMSQRVRIPVVLRRRFCRSCEAFWVLGGNCRVRLRQGVKVVYCLDCKKYTRIPYASTARA